MMRSILAITLLLLTVSGQAQVTISGKVVDSTGHHGIGYCSIALLAEKDSSKVTAAMADSSGRFEMNAVVPGKYFLLVTAVEYRSAYHVIAITHQTGRIEIGDIRMAREHGALQSVTVSAEKRAVQYQADKIVLQVAGNSLYKTAVNAIDIVKKAPGVIENPDGTLLLNGRNPPVIFIDGKPLPMSPEEQQSYLSGLSPEMIESIDIINNPSARYDAQYKAIIDIKLKRNRSQGWLGNLSSSYRQNKYALFENNIQLSYKTKQLTYSLRGGTTHGTYDYLYTALQRHASKNYMATRTANRTGVKNYLVQPGIEYVINKHHTIDISGKFYHANRDLYSHNTLHFTDSTHLETIGITRNINNAEPSQSNNALNVSYDARFGGHRVNIFGSVTGIRNRQQEDIQNTDQLSNERLFYWKTAMKNDIDIRTLQVDYSKQVGRKGLLEAGGKFAFITTRNDLRYDTLNREKSFVPDASRSNQFQYDEYISAGYVSYEFRNDQFTARASVRAEHTYTKANAITLGTIQKRNYLTWLPSALFSYNINANERLNFTFTRRITRPSFDQLNPFRFYFSPLNYWIGNPFLKPSVTSLLNIAYTNKSFNVSLSLGKEEDYMQRYPEYDPVTNELQYLGTNLPYRNFASIESGYGFSITKWWKTNHTLGIYYQKEKTPYHGAFYAYDIVYYTINGNHVFSLPKNFTAELTYYYQSRAGFGLYYAWDQSAVTAGLQRSWLNGKLNTKINFYDMFNQNMVRREFREKAIIDNRFTHFFGNKRFVATVVYNFGKANYKARQTRTTDEEKRVSN